MARRDASDGRWLLPFLAGMATAGAGLLALQAALPRRRGLDPRLIRRAGLADDVPPTVVIPGIMGSGLKRRDGTRVWLNLRNAVGQYSLSLPMVLPLSQSLDDLHPGSLLGTEHRLPRMFGFTEYYDLLELLEGAGFRPAQKTGGTGLVHHVFAYDWRRDLVEAVRHLDETLEALADARGDRNTRFNLVGHSMGGLIGRYYLRYGTAEPDPDAPVTWAGARRIKSLILVATPNGGSVPALDGILLGNRVGLSYTTLSARVVARMPSVYQILPVRGVPSLLDHRSEPIDADLHDIGTWERFGWGPFGPSKKSGPQSGHPDDKVEPREFLAAVLARARAFHRALDRTPVTPCPVKVIALGGDCMPTLARCVVPEKPGLPPRFEPLSRTEADAMFEAGDGRVTRASVLGSHLAVSEESETGAGYPEVSQSFFGSADHHGIYNEPTFQSILLRRLFKPASRLGAASPLSPVDVTEDPEAAAS
jgi:pimeloyl-ACP methyl ester carboxylesterase